jgi:hypothetical protein
VVPGVVPTTLNKEHKDRSHTMKVETKNRKKATAGFRQFTEQEQMRQRMHDILQTGSQALNGLTLELGRELAQFIRCAEETRS